MRLEEGPGKPPMTAAANATPWKTSWWNRDVRVRESGRFMKVSPEQALKRTKS